MPKTPYLANERYDGGPWMSYPTRKGVDLAISLEEYYRNARVKPTPTSELESFLQTWLYFGLIAELTGLNSVDTPPETTADMDQVYDLVLATEGDETYVRLESWTLVTLLVLGRASIPTEIEAKKAWYSHLISCLTLAQPMITRVNDKAFNSALRWSIAALGDLFTYTVNYALEQLQIPKTFARDWSTGLLDESIKVSMKKQGWCPSDIARVWSKYSSIQSLFMARMVDRSLPIRDHSSCTESSCNPYLTNTGEGIPRHKTMDCTCGELVLSESVLTPALLTDEHFPLLDLQGDLHDLECQIIESGTRSYVAISHVWADGLGNPDANSLNKCKLHHLRGLVEDIEKAQLEVSTTGKHALIWLDTLCCPAEDGEGKQRAIEKIRLVYRSAKYVLVLDAGLMSYPAQDQGPVEILLRIFTCGWMRRLWTLQEGALAKSLFFQFADIAVSLTEKMSQLMGMIHSMTHRAIFSDMRKEAQELGSFFYNPEPLQTAAALNLLDRSLQYRGVGNGGAHISYFELSQRIWRHVLSLPEPFLNRPLLISYRLQVKFPSDEPLCIATLLSLDLPTVLAYGNKEDRMREVWELIAIKNGGIPASVIFLAEPRLSSQGWRWAPNSFLTLSHGVLGLSSRLTKWSDPKIGSPTPFGLRVVYPGIRIIVQREYDDGLPRNPWPGLPCLLEACIHFRDVETDLWYRIASSKYAALYQNFTSEAQRQACVALKLVPLHDVIDSGGAALILNSNPALEAEEAILTTVVPEHTNEEGKAVRTIDQIILQELGDEGYILDVVRELAFRLRADDLTKEHLAVVAQVTSKAAECSKEKGPIEENDKVKASLQRLKGKMKDMMAEVVRDDPKFTHLIVTHWGETFPPHMWVFVQDFFNHDYSGKGTAKDQVWFVD